MNLNDEQFQNLLVWSDVNKGASLKVTRRIDTYAAGTDYLEATQVITDSRVGTRTEGDLYVKPVFEKKGQTNSDLISIFGAAANDVEAHAKELVRRIKAGEPGGNSGICNVVFWATRKGQSTILFYGSLLGDTTEPEIVEVYSPGDGVSFICDD